MKQIKTITGHLLAPLRIGYPSLIQESSHRRITSAVQRILDQQDNYILLKRKTESID